MVGVIFGSRLVFQRTCERRTTPWSDLGTADDDEYRILIDAYKIKNQSNETVMIQAFDNTKLIGHYYEREKGAPLIVFFHGLWGHSYLDGVPIYRITQKHNWNLLLCDLRAQGDSEGERKAAEKIVTGRCYGNAQVLVLVKMISSHCRKCFPIDPDGFFTFYFINGIRIVKAGEKIHDGSWSEITMRFQQRGSFHI